MVASNIIKGHLMSESHRKRGLSSLIGALLMIIILVNSVLLLQRYTNYSTKMVEQEIRSKIPPDLQATKLPNGTILLYNNENSLLRIRYLIYSNSSYRKTDLLINPKSDVLLSENNLVALITDDSHVIMIPSKPVSWLGGELNQSCISLKKIVQIGIGDAYLSRVYRYYAYPSINSIVLKKSANYSLDKYLQIDLSRISYSRLNVAYLSSNPTFIRQRFDEYNNRTLIVNITETGFETSYRNNYVYGFNSSKYLEDVKEIYLIPITGSIYIDDENMTTIYHIHYSSAITRLYLYENGELIDTISSGNYLSMGYSFNVTIKRIGTNRLLFLLKANNANYKNIIQYFPGATLSLGTSVKIRSVIINETTKLYPSIVIDPPPLDNEYALQLNDTKPIYASVRNVFRYYSLNIYPTYISLINNGFRLKGNGSLVYDANHSKPLLLYYAYKPRYHFTVSYGPFTSVIGLEYNGYSRFLIYYIIPYISENSPILEIDKDTVSNKIVVKAFSESNRALCKCSFSTIFLQKLYVHSSEDKPLAIYNYIPAIGNLLLNYPQVLSNEKYPIILSSRYMNLTNTELLDLVQYNALNGSVDEITLCFKSNYMGHIRIKGSKNSMVYMVKPDLMAIQAMNEIIIGDNYIVAKIPDNGTLTLSFTTLSQKTP